MKLLRMSLFITSICSTASAFMPEFWTFMISRTISGFGIGMSIPAGSTYMAEVCPGKNRGMFMVMLQIYFALGSVSIVGVSYWIVPDLSSGYAWRYMILLSAAPNFLAAILASIFYYESPHFLAKKG